jgi:two-component system cell cycle response regulator
MKVAAHILFVSDRDDSAAISADLKDRGYQLIAAADPNIASQALAESPADVIVVSLVDDDKAVSIARILQARTGDRALPAVVVANDSAGANQNIGKLEVMTRPVEPADLHNRLAALSRLVTMQDELSRRAETTRAYGLEGPEMVTPPVEVNNTRIMLIGSDGPQLAAARTALTGSAQVTLRPTPFLALETLLNEQFDAAVAVLGEDAETALDFCRDARNNTRLYNLPIVLIADSDEFASPNAPFDAFASDVLARNCSQRQIADRTMHLVRLGRYRDALQEVYRSARHFATSDALTGLFSHGYLHAHLAKMIADAGRSNKPLSVGFFDVGNMGSINQAHGYVTGDQILRQIGGMIGSLVRCEDLPARYGGGKFCIILPDTTAEAAAPVIRRIAGVINFTDFAVPGIDRTVSVDMHSGLAQLERDDGEESLIARSRARLSRG